MDSVIFHEGLLESITMDFEPALFNTPEFMLLQADATQWLSFYALDKTGKKAVASIHFHLVHQIAQSPFKAPFGSVECSEDLNPKTLFQFLEFVEKTLRKKGADEIHIKNPPRQYSPPMLSLLETILLNQKYSIREAEVSAVLPIRLAEFDSSVRPSEASRSRQAKSAGLRFATMPADDFNKVFDFIADCHAQKGYHLSISRQQLQDSIRTFPDRYLLFAVFEEQRMVAAAVSVIVKKEILYNFLVNHEREYNRLSPPVLLMEGTFGFCRENGIRLFDLGTSALNGAPNFSLLDFKLRLGAKASSKFTFHKKLS